MDRIRNLHSVSLIAFPTLVSINLLAGLGAVLIFLLLSPPQRRIRISPLVALLAWSICLSAILASSWDIQGLIRMISPLLLVYSAALFIQRLKRVDALPLFVGIAVMVAIAVPISVFQVHGLGLPRATGFWFHPNLLGLVGVTAAVYFLSTSFWCKERLWTGASLLLAAAAVILVVYSGSRGAVLAMGIGIALIVAFRYWHRWRANQGQSGALLIGAVLVAAFALVYVGSQALTIGPLDRSAELNSVWSPLGRDYLWAVGLEMIAARPILGWGPTGWMQNVQSFEPSIRVDRLGHSHSLYLEIALEAGLTTLLLFALATYKLIAVNWKPAAGQHLPNVQALSIIAVVLVANTTDVLLYQPSIALLVFVLLAHSWIQLEPTNHT